METQERICRLCLKTCDNFKGVEGDIKNMLHVVFLTKIDLTAIWEPVLCTTCTEMLIKCFDFKTACFDTFDYIVPFTANKNDVKVALKDIYLSKNENGTGVPEGQVLCGFCMDLVENCSAICLGFEDGDGILKKMIEQSLPELDLGVIENPVICEPCHKSLVHCFRFVTNCLVVEERIDKYRETVAIDSKGRIELSSLLQFTLKDVTGGIEGSPDDIIKSEKPFSVEGEYADDREISKGCDIFKLEQIICDDSKNTEEMVDYKIKSIVDIDGLEFKNVQQFSSENIVTVKEESDNAIGITETLYVENETQLVNENYVDVKDQKFLVDEEMEIKTNEKDFNRSEDNVLPAPTLTTRQHSTPDLEADLPTYRCEFCSFQSSRIGDFKNRCELSGVPVYRCNACSNERSRERPPRVTTYECNACSYSTKYKGDLKTHSLTHKSPSEVRMYSCDSCAYRSKYKGSLKSHLLVHMSPSEVKMYKCNRCLYQTKEKYVLKKHSLIHKDASEVEMYRCNVCPFQTKRKITLKTHSLVHKDLSEITRFGCDSCSYQGKTKGALKRHALTHKRPSEVVMYKCNSCPYEAKFKNSLKKHLLVHTDPSNVTMYACNVCSFQTKHEGSLKKHSQVHDDPLEAVMYTCDSCSYQSRYKGNLKHHVLLMHTDRTEVPMYKCNACSYESKEEGTLKLHLLVHKDTSEVVMYKCNSCSYQAKRKRSLKRHLMVHKDASEVEMYSCNVCSFQTKYKNYLKRHLWRHESKVCGAPRFQAGPEDWTCDPVFLACGDYESARSGEQSMS